ncbi:MAG TPA: GNAT family N-acetyltransferase [Thermoanaerobaculia bacterium]|nr:GNAT family N-acetyltransferase [Thermoanaerobaculia bacterium]
MQIRLATAADVPAIAALIPVSARALSRGFYTDAQTEAAIRHIFGPDTRLIADGTYFVVDADPPATQGAAGTAPATQGAAGTAVVACGGWSRRRTLYGGDQMKSAEDPLLDPAVDAARIRAFFVHPGYARRGVGRAILDACLSAARAAGFRRVELAATLPGVPFYRAFGFAEREALEAPMPGGPGLPVVRMDRAL